MDCLDRTNAVQTKISFYMLNKVLKKYGVKMI